MEETAGTLRRRGRSLFPVEARAGHGLCHRGKAVPPADRCGIWLGVPSADQRGRWLVGRAPLALLDASLSSRQCTLWGAGAVVTLLRWVRIAVAVVITNPNMDCIKLYCQVQHILMLLCSQLVY